MRFLLAVIFLFCGTSLDNYGSVNTYEGSFSPEKILPQDAPFYFLKPVPSSMKLNSGADLSFFRNRSIVVQYRFRLEIPDGTATAIDRDLTRWSPWISSDFIELIIPILDLEGGYRFNIEYKESKGTEILKFEKLFYVYRLNLGTNIETAKIKTVPATGNAKPYTAPVESKPAAKSPPVADKTSSGPLPENKKVIRLMAPKMDKITIETASIDFTSLNEINPRQINDSRDYYRHIEKEPDPVTDVTDINGNSPLHTAILSGESEYALSLINQGADLNILNNMELSPLHIAILLNDRTVANNLMIKGAKVDIPGNTGYTPLHIASEMNNFPMVKELLSMGATSGIKTDQKLNSGTIAEIQGNYEIGKLISKKGKYAGGPSIIDSKNYLNYLNSANLNPKMDFILPYDNELAKKRQFNKVLQILSVPVFSFSVAVFTFLKSESNNYYSLSQIAETEEMARDYYNKGNQYNTFANISGGISLVSIYGFIHSTIRKKNISKSMRKIFN